MKVRRVEASDVLSRDGQTLALFDTQLVWLSELGALAYERADAPITVADLADALRAEFGEPPTGSLADAVSSLVDDLVARGVLSQVDDAAS